MFTANFRIETDDSGFYDGKTLHADEADTHGVVQSNLNGNVLKTPTSNEVVCLGYHKRGNICCIVVVNF